MTSQRFLSSTGFFVFLLIAAAFVRADEPASIKVLEKAKAMLLVDDKNAEKPVVGVIMWGSSYQADLLKELREIKHLQKLRIGGPWINDEAVKTLHELKGLQMLEIRSPRVSDGALKELQAALPNLKLRRANPGETPFAALLKK